MQVIKNFSGDAGWGVIPYIQHTMDKLSDDSSDIAFFNGVEFIYDKNLRDKYKDFSRRCLFAHWSPCEFMNEINQFHFEAYEFFTEVYCVCPFTCKFMNEYFGYEKFKYVPYLYTNHTEMQFGEYDSLCTWFGSIHGNDHIQAIDVISKFPYKFITSQQNTWMHHPYEYHRCTHVNISTDEKLRQVSKSRASLTINKLHKSPSTIYNGKYKNLTLGAYNQWHKGELPQFKVRTHEIATCKSLILALKDDWNLIEDFYTPDEHFVYFETFNELEEILHDVNNNFEKYIPIIERAYEQVQNYTVEKLFKYIETNDDSSITWRSKYV